MHLSREPAHRLHSLRFTASVGGRRKQNWQAYQLINDKQKISDERQLGVVYFRFSLINLHSTGAGKSNVDLFTGSHCLVFIHYVDILI